MVPEIPKPKKGNRCVNYRPRSLVPAATPLLIQFVCTMYTLGCGEVSVITDNNAKCVQDVVVIPYINASTCCMCCC